jgi:ABC-type transporter Mla subunit MlaD
VGAPVHEQEVGVVAEEPRYFKIGLFLLLGVAMITVMAVFLGLGLFTRDTIPAESYFDYSVEGVGSGSEVMFRGVSVGTVRSIGLVHNEYSEAEGPMERFVLVRMALFRDRVRAFTADDPENRFADEIAKGLRVVVSVQLLTGEGSLQLEYLDPERNPVPPITWDPESLFIPSAPSTINRLEEMLVRFSDTLGDVNFERLTESINSLSRAMAGADIEALGRSMAETLEGIGSLVATMNEIVGDPEAVRIIPRTAELLDGLEETAGNLREASSVLTAMMTAPEFKEGVAGIPETLGEVNHAAAEISRGAGILADTARTLQQLTGDQRYRVDSIVESLERTARNFQELSEEARLNPSRFLFSEPPARSPIDR